MGGDSGAKNQRDVIGGDLGARFQDKLNAQSPKSNPMFSKVDGNGGKHQHYYEDFRRTGGGGGGGV
jgi:hypothetical protein